MKAEEAISILQRIKTHLPLTGQAIDLAIDALCKQQSPADQCPNDYPSNSIPPTDDDDDDDPIIYIVIC